jgi:ABC-type transporter Mla MlaB component
MMDVHADMSLELERRLLPIAGELGISRRTVTRYWRTIRHQLVKEIAA